MPLHRSTSETTQFCPINPLSVSLIEPSVHLENPTHSCGTPSCQISYLCHLPIGAKERGMCEGIERSRRESPWIRLATVLLTPWLALSLLCPERSSLPSFYQFRLEAQSQGLDTAGTVGLLGAWCHSLAHTCLSRLKLCLVSTAESQLCFSLL